MLPNPFNNTATVEGRWKRWVQLKEHDGDVGLFEENKLPGKYIHAILSRVCRCLGNSSIFSIVQWQAWLRHTRFEAPRIQELVQEQRRLAILRERVRKLEIAEQEEKLRLANKQHQEPVQEHKEKVIKESKFNTMQHLMNFHSLGITGI